MIAATDHGWRRVGLDALVACMTEPGFSIQFRRLPVLRERAGHVSPSMLAMQPRRSRYVRTWRRHAIKCPECAAMFRYFGFPLR
jgi:hypothetical protein